LYLAATIEELRGSFAKAAGRFHACNGPPSVRRGRQQISRGATYIKEVAAASIPFHDAQVPSSRPPPAPRFSLVNRGIHLPIELMQILISGAKLGENERALWTAQ
jgi:hypothetical protein